MKKISLFIFALISMFAFTFGVSALDVSNEQEFIDALKNGGDIKLTDNIEVTKEIILDTKVTLDLNGKDVVIIGRGNIVGKPLAMALENRNATVSLLHSKTKDMIKYTKNADIVVTACGVPKLLKADMIKQGAVVIDVGISRTDTGIVGDIDFESIKDVALFVTPNPGGVGPMTVAMIIDNLIEMSEV